MIAVRDAGYLLLISGLWAAACSSSSDAGRDSVEPPVFDGGVSPWKPHETPDQPAGSLSLEKSGGGSGGGAAQGGSGGGAGTQTSPGGDAGTAPVVWCPGLPATFNNVARATPADATRMASATRAREDLRASRAPLPASVRGPEFENFYAEPLSHPQKLSATLWAEVEMRKTKIGAQEIPGQFDLFVGIEGKPPVSRPPVALTLLVDTTQSMGDLGLSRAKAALLAIAGQLQAQDSVRLLTTDPSDASPKSSSPGTAAEELKAWTDQLALGPEASVPNRIAKAYELAKGAPNTAVWNRVVVVSDGEGSTNELPKALMESEAQATSPIFFVGIGVGNEFGESLLYRATEYGRGPYAYLDDPTAADAVIGAKFDRLFGILFTDLQVTVTAPWFAEVLDPGQTNPPDYGEPLNSARPQHLAPGAVLRFAFRLRLCDAKILGDSLEIVKPLVLTISAKPATEQSVVSSDLPFKFEKLVLASPTTDMDKYLATRAFVAALRAPTPERFQEASELLTPFAAQLQWPAADEMLSLLDLHPANQKIP